MDQLLAFSYTYLLFLSISTPQDDWISNLEYFSFAFCLIYSYRLPDIKKQSSSVPKTWREYYFLILFPGMFINRDG